MPLRVDVLCQWRASARGATVHSSGSLLLWCTSRSEWAGRSRLVHPNMLGVGGLVRFLEDMLSDPMHKLQALVLVTCVRPVGVIGIGGKGCSPFSGIVDMLYIRVLSPCCLVQDMSYVLWLMKPIP
ncbi:unnamed protein product [Ostreobium quekettii]|uniref:Uncharacterized protein n=1 Tax=Ostreobium quekettii TaxID=121088 RepID=A0A8S1J9S0_9CHLO|nr:unnamed protein product [Ostreobium quekettii]